MEFDHGGYPPAYNGLLDFSSNVNPLPFPKSVREGRKEFWERIRYYPDPFCQDLKSLIAKRIGIKEDEIFIGAGSTELIYLLVMTLRPKSTLVFLPTFSEYEKASRIANACVLELNLDSHFSLPAPLAEEVDILFLCHPNNPTGNFLVREKEEIFSWKSKYYLIDEAFIDFAGEEYSYIGLFRKDKRVLILRTFTKFFPLAGMRIGYLIAERSIVDRLERVAHPWRVSGLSIYLAEKFLEDEDFQKRTRALIERERKYLENGLGKLGFKVYPSVANFFLVGLRSNETSRDLKEKLLKQGILVRDCSNFKGLKGEFIRLCVRMRRENRILLQALSKI